MIFRKKTVDAKNEYVRFDAEAVNEASARRYRHKLDNRAIGRRFFYILTALFVCAIFIGICIAVFFRAQNITVTGNSFYTTEELLEACSLSDKPNLFSVKSSDLEKRVVAKLPYVSKISIKRVLPSSLVINVKEEAPVYYTIIDGDYFLLSSSLRVLVISKDNSFLNEMPGLIRISTPRVKSAILGYALEFIRDKNFDFTLGLIGDIAETVFNSNINFIDASDKYHIVLIMFDGRYRIQLGNNENISEKLDFVKAVMDKSFNENSIAQINVEYLDSAIVTLGNGLYSY